MALHPESAGSFLGLFSKLSECNVVKYQVCTAIDSAVLAVSEAAGEEQHHPVKYLADSN